MIFKVVVAFSFFVVLIAALAAIMWAFQERIAFQPPRGPWPEPSGVSRMDYHAADGQPLFAYIAGESSAPRALLVAFHGNADLAVRQIDWAREIVRRTSVTVMLAEYRGYMGLPGQPGYTASRLDSEAAYLFARDSLHVPAERIAFFGHSLGSAVATELALKHPPAALVLQAPFTSARDMAGRMIGYTPSFFLWRLMSRLHFDTVAGVSEIQAPVSVSHGDQDHLIPATMGSEVFAAARQKGAWLLVSGAAHNDVPLRGGEQYWNWIAAALQPVRSR